jgi:pimeloyl-ACP methyl ester carboxylesterase
MSPKQQTLHSLLGAFPPGRFMLSRRIALPSALYETRVEQLYLTSSGGQSIRAILTGPPGEWRSLPAILYCHAHGNRYDIGANELVEGRPALLNPPYGQALAHAGIMALCIDLPCFGERASQQESVLAKRYLWQGQTLFGAMLAELTAALDLLEAITGVDPDRIGIFGLSMGATLAFWLGALEPRLKAIAHLCCFADLATLVEQGGHDLHGLYMTVPGLLQQFSTGEIAGLAAPRPQFVGIGLQDPLTPQAAVDIAVAQVRAAYSTSGDESRFTVFNEPDSGHRETPDMRTEVLRFFKQHL